MDPRDIEEEEKVPNDFKFYKRDIDENSVECDIKYDIQELPRNSMNNIGS